MHHLHLDCHRHGKTILSYGKIAGIKKATTEVVALESMTREEGQLKDENNGEHIKNPVYFFSFSDYKLQDRIRDETEGNSCRNAGCKRHGQYNDESRESIIE